VLLLLIFKENPMRVFYCTEMETNSDKIKCSKKNKNKRIMNNEMTIITKIVNNNNVITPSFV